MMRQIQQKSNPMKIGDLIVYNDDANDRLGTIGLVVGTAGDGPGIADGSLYGLTVPPMVNILWESGELEEVYEDELRLVEDNIEVIK